jgi:hypothetical protein
MGAAFRQHDSGTLGQGRHGFGEAHVFIFHDEMKYIPPDTTAKAVEDLLLAGHSK